MATRIQVTQKNVQELLAAQPQYVVNTSEFQEVKQNLTLLANARRATPEKSGPTLRRPVGSTPSQRDGEGAKSDEDERPTLKRRNP